MNSTDEIIQYLENLGCYKYDLVITYVDGMYEQSYLDKITKFKPETKFLKYKNHGYDIGPFIDVLSKVNLKEYDVVIKMHSKGARKNIYIYNQFFRGRDWFGDLWNGVLGCFSVHRTIDRLYRKKKYGLVAAKNLIIHDPKHKQQLTKRALKAYGIKYVNNYYFVAGSCFAIRSVCLNKVKELKLTIKNFEKTERGTFSLAHAMERAVCFTIMPDYEFYGNRVDWWRHLKWRKAEKSLNRLSAMRRLDEMGEFEIRTDYMWHVIEGQFVKNIRMKEIPLGDIRRSHPQAGKIIGLDECEPYLYLKGGQQNINKYKEYCKLNSQGVIPWKMSVERFEKLINSIKKNGYDEHYPIIVDNKNIICDGQHRACILLYLYGKKYVIRVIEVEEIMVDLKRIKPFCGHIPCVGR